MHCTCIASESIQLAAAASAAAAVSGMGMYHLYIDQTDRPSQMQQGSERRGAVAAAPPRAALALQAALWLRSKPRQHSASLSGNRPASPEADWFLLLSCLLLSLPAHRSPASCRPPGSTSLPLPQLWWHKQLSHHSSTQMHRGKAAAAVVAAACGGPATGPALCHSQQCAAAVCAWQQCCWAVCSGCNNIEHIREIGVMQQCRGDALCK
jgi:hypothetical protein